MEKDKKVIYPMMIELNETIKDTLYYVSLPKEVKDKWIELERKSKSSYNSIYNLPTVTLKNMFNNYLDGVIDISPVSNSSDDSKWLVSFKKVNIKVVLNCFRIWVDEFYIKGGLTKDFKRKDGKDENVKSLAKELIVLLSPETFGEVLIEEVILFENGSAINKEGYQLYPLRIINSLMGQSITFKGIETKLLYSSRNELVTDTHNFHSGEDYYSFVIKLSVQTLPPDNKAYLNVDLSVRRWISRNEKEDGKIYLKNDKNCYIRVKGDKMQSIKTEYDKDKKENIWKSIDYRCFKECQVECTVPLFTEVLEQPGEYNHGNVGDILIPYEEGINFIDTSVKSGVTFIDRKTAFEFVKNQLETLDNIISNVKAVNIKKIVKNSKNDFNESKDSIKIESEVFLNQLDKALDGEKLTIEIYSELEVRDALFSKLEEYFKCNSKHEFKFCEAGDICSKLVKTPTSRDNNLPGFEIRKEEIVKKLNKVSKPTLAFIAIQNKKYFNDLDKKTDVDPKKAIRCGFAETGRLTQFITYEEFSKEEKRIEESDEKYEKKLENALKAGKELQARSKNEKLNKAVEGTILDGFRQLGVVFDYAINKKMKGKKIVGIHICNYKRTFYGSIPPFPIIITYDVDNSKVMAYCELVDKIDVPYWKAILGLSKLASMKDIGDFAKTISNTTINRRLDRIINKENSDTIIIIDADGTSRKIIKGISNSEIEKSEMTEFRQVKKLLISDGRYIDLTEHHKGLSIIRLRHNDEVPSYFTMDKGLENKEFIQQSGIFQSNNIYYSVDGRPPHEGKVYDKQVSKAVDKGAFSHRNAIEIYPMYVSGDEKSHEENEKIAVGIVDMLRKASIQFTSQKTILPLPLHLAEKMEEYI